MATPDLLLIDISNSFTKVTRASAEALIGSVARIPTAKLTAAAIAKVAGKMPLRGVVLSSVVPKATAAVKAFAKAFPSQPRLVEVNHRADLGLAIDYPNPRSIGADRLANAAGAVALYGSPVIVIDFGTAVTFDVIAQRGGRAAYVGGVIAPGLEAMTDYLHQRTALLPKIDLSEPVSAIGQSTREAMLAGAVYGYRGLIRQILEELGRELNAGRHLKTVATGGYAELISERLLEVQQIHPSLTLEGLRMIARRNL
jgi:type III pantothenate kinase